MRQIKPLDEDHYALDSMSLEDAPVIALIEKVNEIIEVVNSLMRNLPEPK